MAKLGIILLCYAALFFCLGLGPGFPALYVEVSKRGLFSNHCSANFTNGSNYSSRGDITDATLVVDGYCEAQPQHMAVVVNLALNLLNVFSSVGGLLTVVVGPVRLAMASLLAWIVFFGIGGISPPSGIAWSISFVGFNLCCNFFFYGSIAGLLKVGTRGDEAAYTLHSSILTGVWDASIILNSFLHYLLQLEALQGASLWMLYLVYALALGGPLWGASMFWLRRDIIEEKAQSEGIGAACKTVVHTFKNALTAAFFWLGVSLSTSAVFVGYFFVANIRVFSLLSASDAVADRVAFWLPFFMAIGFFGTFIPGLLINRFGKVNGMRLTNGVGLVITLVIVILASTHKGGSLAQQLVTCAFFGIWRSFCFATGNVYHVVVFAHPRSASFLGIHYTVAGIFSIIVGTSLTAYVQDHPHMYDAVSVPLWVLAMASHIAVIVLLPTVHRRFERSAELHEEGRKSLVTNE
jgi:hypothetical protein